MFNSRFNKPMRIILSSQIARSLIVSLVAYSSLSAAVIVTAPGSASAYSNSNNALPFMQTTADYQQIYSSSLFSSLPAGGGFIDSIAFRPAGLDSLGNKSPDIDVNYSSLEISLSTTSVAVGSLDPLNPSLDLGSNNTIVFDQTNFSMLATSTGDPTNFDFSFSIAPFFYNPANGNLLIDVQSGIAAYYGGYLDYDSTQAGQIVTSRYYDVPAWSANAADNGGLVTQFVVNPGTPPTQRVPDSTGGIVDLSLLGLVLLHFLYQRRQAAGLRAQVVAS
jgi:hypothetical protein